MTGYHLYDKLLKILFNPSLIREYCTLLPVIITDDRYQVLTTGELLIHKTNMADKDRTYRCRVQNTITNRILVSAKPATAHIVGEYLDIFE